MSTQVRSSAPTDNIAERSTKEHKVVIRMASGEVVKGHLTVQSDISLEDLLDQAALNGSHSIHVRSLVTGEPVSVVWREVKSIFFVKSFRGDAARRGLRFYAKGPAVGGILAEIRFNDSEVIEGTIDNSARHIMADGILLHPSDPDSNNIMIYANKAAITNYRVLGVKGHSESEN